MRRLCLFLLVALSLIVLLPGSAELTTSASGTGPDTIFGSAKPASVDSGDPNAVELGVKFTADENGTVTGVRFYKAPKNTGTHVGALWTVNGTLLARATFTHETSSGWETVDFSRRVSIAAHTVYIAGYYAPHGHYSAKSHGLSSAIMNGPLTAPAGSSVGGNGVYTYDGSSTFPLNHYRSTTYYVDVDFVPRSTSTSSSTTSSSSTETSTSTSSTTTSTSMTTSTATTSAGTCLQIPGPLGDAFEDPLPASNYPDFAALDACGYPSPDTAGVPASATLTTVTATCGCLPANVSWNASDNQLTVSGPATIDDLRIEDGYVAIETSGSVLFQDDLIRCSGCDQGSPIINLQGNGGVTMRYSTVGGVGGGSDCTSPSSDDIGISGGVLDHDVFDCSVTPVNGQRFTVTNSYLIVDAYTPTSHNEAIYQPGGGSNDIEHNTLLDPLSATAVIFMDAKLGAEGPTTIKNNLVAGAGYGDGAIAGGGAAVSVEDNRFSGAYGSNDPGGVCSDTTWSGNYADHTLAAVPLPTSRC